MDHAYYFYVTDILIAWIFLKGLGFFSRSYSFAKWLCLMLVSGYHFQAHFIYVCSHLLMGWETCLCWAVSDFLSFCLSPCFLDNRQILLDQMFFFFFFFSFFSFFCLLYFLPKYHLIRNTVVVLSSVLINPWWSFQLSKVHTNGMMSLSFNFSFFWFIWHNVTVTYLSSTFFQ